MRKAPLREPPAAPIIRRAMRPAVGQALQRLAEQLPIDPLTPGS